MMSLSLKYLFIIKMLRYSCISKHLSRVQFVRFNSGINESGAMSGSEILKTSLPPATNIDREERVGFNPNETRDLNDRNSNRYSREPARWNDHRSNNDNRRFKNEKVPRTEQRRVPTLKSCPVHFQERKELEVDEKLSSMSSSELETIRELLKHNSVSSIKAIVRSMRFDMKFKRVSEYEEIETKSSPNQRVRNTRHPIGIHRNERLDSAEGDMEITFLGTSSSVPNMSRGVSCTAFRFDSEMYLFDCGESSQLQFLYSDISTRKVNKIFITHLHGDHIFGLPAILCGLGSMYAAKVASNEMTQDELDKGVLDIYGPEGLREFIRSALILSKAKLTAPHRIHELKNIPLLDGDSNIRGYPKNRINEDSANINPTQYHFWYGEREGNTDIFPDKNGVYHLGQSDTTTVNKNTGAVTIKAAPLSHAIPCVGYVIEEASRPGTLRIDKIAHIIEENSRELSRIYRGNAMRVNKYIKILKPDESFVFPNGTEVFGRDVVEPEIVGRKIVIMGDTCNSDRMVQLAMDADVLIHEATVVPESMMYSDSNRTLTEEAKKRHHSTPQMAGEFAKQIKAKQLLLTHFSKKCSGHHNYEAMKGMWALEDSARESVPELSGPNDIIAAWDFMRFSIPHKNDARKNLEIEKKR